MPPQTNTIKDILSQMELDRLYAGKSSGDSGSLIAAMQGQQRLASMPQGGAVQSLTPIGPLDFLAETAITGASQMEDMNPLALLLAGALAPGAYKKLKTTNTPALLKKFDVKVDNPLYHNTDIGSAKNILKTGRIRAGTFDQSDIDATGRSISLTRDPAYSAIPGVSPNELSTQFILDKKDVASARGVKIKPYVYKADIQPKFLNKEDYLEKFTERGSPIFGKSSPWFEAEERVVLPSFRKGSKIIPGNISSGKIKAIKIRSAPKDIAPKKDVHTPEYSVEYHSNSLSSLLKRAADKKIPLIIEPAAEEGVMGLLDLMNPKQQSKVLKNTKFAGRQLLEDTPFKKMKRTDVWAGLENPVYEGIVNGKKVMIQRNTGASFDEWSEVTGSDFKIGRYLGSTKKEAIKKLQGK